MKGAILTAGRVRCAAVAAAALGGALLMGSALPALLGVTALAAVIAFLLTPLCARLEGRLSRGMAAFAAVAGTVLLAAALGVLALPGLLGEISLLGEALRAFAQTAMDGYGYLRGAAAEYGVQLPEIGKSEAFASGWEKLIPTTISVAGTLADGVYRLSLGTVLACFFLADRDSIALRVEMLIPIKWRCGAVAAGIAVRREMRLYVKGQVMISLAVGALAAAGLWAIGVPASPVLGIIVGVLNLVPYFGPVLGGIPAVIMALRGGVSQALMAAAVLFGVQQVDGLLISPRIMGALTGLSPAVVLLAVFAGSGLAGVMGMLFALPVLMVIRTLFRVFVQTRENL